jgi:hypothetical protein
MKKLYVMDVKKDKGSNNLQVLSMPSLFGDYHPITFASLRSSLCLTHE